jgi:hypothetical protein
MDAVSAVKFGARVDSVSAVKSMDHEQHWLGLDSRSCHPRHFFPFVHTVPCVSTGIMYASRRRFLDIELATAKIALHDPVLGAVRQLTPSMGASSSSRVSSYTL